ncbi:MAG: hypothetical protein IJI57_13855 [Flexilinea sp.]|nr:hypothetical protein [Flexilinea sp.]
MRLFEPPWKTSKREKLSEALASVRDLNDLKKLREAALYAYLPEVQSEALKRITDPHVLSEVILANSTAYEIRREAVRRISDPEVLAEIAMRRQAYPADGDAIALLSDPEQLRRIALSEQGGEQDKAVYKIRKQDILGEIAVNAKKGSARKTAIRCITDPDILLNILSSAEEVYTRSEAFDRLVQLRKSRKLPELSEAQHQKLIEYIIHENDRNVRIETDEFQTTDDLARIYREAARYDLRAKALSRLVLDESFPNGCLLEVWKTTENNRKVVHNTFSNPWQDAQQIIETRISDISKRDPQVLLEFIRDPDVTGNYAAECLKYLFEKKHDDSEKIGYLRDEAFAAFLRNIPEYAARDKKDSPEEYLLCLAHSIPHEFYDQYGLTVFMEEYDQTAE